MDKTTAIEVQKMLDENCSITEISKTLGITRTTLSSYVSKLNGLRICLSCGNTVTKSAGTRTKKFCSDRCRIAWWNCHSHEMQHRIAAQTVCKYCGKTFVNNRTRERKYCSRACFDASRRESNELK